jgi:preprotein translocase subunit SecE
MAMSTVEQVKPTPVRGAERATDGIMGWWENSRTFLTEVRNEMRRVTWPGRKEVWATTVVVIIVSGFFGLYLWGLDLGLSWIVNAIFRSFGAA